MIKIKKIKANKVKDLVICDSCGKELSEPVYEQREDGNSEMVTYCSCGATYTN